MNNAIETEANKRGITRLCHFTPSRNFSHILSDEVGIFSTKSLNEEERKIFNQTDLHRLDNHEDFICCSIQYPNAWYFTKAMTNEVLFEDWVILLINPKYIWQTGTRFCPRNAASNGGRNIVEGISGFLSLFEQSIQGAHGTVFSRLPKHLDSCPTDQQAEVLIPKKIALSDIIGTVVKSEEQAKNEILRLELCSNQNLNNIKFIIAPDFFDKHKLSDSIKNGIKVVEKIYDRVN